MPFSDTPFVRVLRGLWQLLPTRRRVIFACLIFALLVAGVLEMGGMLFIFGFIGGLHIDPDTGARGGRLTWLFEFLHGGAFGSNFSYVLVAGGAVLGILFFKNLLSSLVQFGLMRFLFKLNQSVSVGLYRRELLSPYERIRTLNPLGRSGRVLKVFNVFSDCFANVAQVLADGSMLLMVCALLMLIDPLLTIGAAFVFGGVGSAMYLVVQRSLTVMADMDSEARKEATQQLEFGIDGVVDARLRDLRPQLLRDYGKALAKTSLLRRRTSALRRLPRSTNELLLAFLVVGSVFYLSVSGHSIEQALPTLGIFGFAGLRMTGAMTRVNASFQRLRSKAKDFDKLYREVALSMRQLARHEEENDYLSQEQPLPSGMDGRMQESLRASNVSFTYPHAPKPSIRNISVEIPRGGLISFCGPSGGGKSTLVQLLMGLMTPTEGVVRCDDWDIHHHIRVWQQNLGYVGQDSYVVPLTVRSNVAYGIPAAKVHDSQVLEALHLASADRFVSEYKGGIDHEIKAGGKNLSGGQMQRLMIARALYDNPDILVFDEATAALDNATEREITEALKKLSGTKTVITIAHRLSTIRASDCIHVVEDGSISASGTYDELLERSETFARLVAASEAD